MKTVKLITPLALALALAACDKAGTPPKPTTSSADTGSGSVAQAPSAVPPSDATMKPAPPTAPGSGNAATPTQANPAPLTREQEQSSLPHTGQVNNHSTPETTSAK